jgi:hypothetical protein
MEKQGTWFFASSRLLIRTPYAFPGDTLKISLTANKIILTSGNESGMIEVIDSMNQIETPRKKDFQTGNKSGRSSVITITTE